MKAAIALLIASLAVANQVLALPPPRYFPLDPGSRWTYVQEGTGARTTVTVIGLEGGAYSVDFGGSVRRIGGSPDALDIEIPGEGFVPYYRFSEPSWVHRDFRLCDDGRELTAAGTDHEVETPAGVFQDCLRLDYGPSDCSDGGRTSEWWAYEVGLVRWDEVWIGGLRTWLLQERDQVPLRVRFRRGDADDDGEVALTDAVFTLDGLFRGGAAPGCGDAADSNDDGDVDIADSVYTLLFLFSGGAAPPFPGPDVPGYDGTPSDPLDCGDPPYPEPEWESFSTLPGVRFDLTGNPPAITLAQAAAGVTFTYRTVIEEDLAGVVARPLDAGGCNRPGPSGLAVLETIWGGTQRYCLCDVGPCPPQADTVDLERGTFEGQFTWRGRNWLGPSDTMNPEGDPFPPGGYVIELRAEGTFPGSLGKAVEYEVHAAVSFELVP